MAPELERQLAAYHPCCEQEAVDRDVMLHFLRENTDAFTRENLVAHFTASSWIVNSSRTHALMAWHNLREAREETGLVHVAPVFPEIFSLETLWVEGHEKRGKYVPSHLHLNVTYLLEADAGDALRAKPDENSGVRWFMLDEAVEASTEEWMRARVYEKLNRKVRALG